MPADPNFTVSMRSPVQTRHLVASPLELLLRLACAYATHEQLPAHSAAHSVALLFPTTTNLSGAFITGTAKNTSSSPLTHLSSSFRRHPFPNLPALHSASLAGSNPSRHLHAGTGTAVPSQYPYAPQLSYVLQATYGNDTSVAHADAEIGRAHV